MKELEDNFKKDLVSIIIPTYNRGNNTLKSIESVKNQTYKNWELIIVDDCSTDNSPEVIQKFIAEDSRIIFKRLNQNSGACAARNLGISNAQGEYITFLDSDDEYYPDKILKQVELFKTSGDESLGVVSCGRVDYRDGKKYRKALPQKKENCYKSLLEKENRIGAGTPFLMVKASVIKENEIFFDPEMPAMQDWDFLIRVCKKFKYDFVPDYLVKVNHSSSIERIYNSKNAVRALEIQYGKYKNWLMEYPHSHLKFVKRSAVLMAHHKSPAYAEKFIQSIIKDFEGRGATEIRAFLITIKLFEFRYFKLFYLKYLN